MRIKSKIYNNGDIRIVRRFLLLPHSVNEDGMMITRWLEWATIKQKKFHNMWTTLEFVYDKNKQNEQL